MAFVGIVIQQAAIDRGGGGRVGHVNAAWTRMCGYTAQECAGVDLKELIDLIKEDKDSEDEEELE